MVDIAFNGSGVWDTEKMLKVRINTVICTLNNSYRSEYLGLVL
ncbi:hypothetical protein J8629_10705 [Serratia fonticola]|nr:hypothetical protein [Serratia fonticola]MBP1003190.1 hypothetical protein [Serratia fonticola]MBP1013071.1 hypothetical protein [Serratia fonticola]